MPVIINDFEIIAQPPEPPPNASIGERQPAAEPALRPVDIIRIQEHHAQRMSRLDASGDLPGSTL